MKASPAIRASFLVFGSPMIEEPEIAEVVDSLRSGWLSTGPKVSRFEDMFRDYIGTRHAIALNSCTAGLHLAMLVSGVKPGDEVITTPLTFAATANAIIHVGARPVFVDVDPIGGNIDPVRVEEALTPRTRALIPVHLAGRPCAMDALMSIAKRHRLILIEDAAHAIEASYHGRKIGAIGDLAAFSFYVTKNLVTGEGGMVTTSRDHWAEQIKTYALHGLSHDAWRRYSDEGFKQYRVTLPGYKYNMMDIQAAMGIHQLPRVDRYLARRAAIWERYTSAFAPGPLQPPPDPQPDTVHARHLYQILIDPKRVGMSRDVFQQRLHERRIGTGVHFMSLHLHPCYQQAYGYQRGDFPNAEHISERTLSLPLSAKLTDKDVEDVITAVHDVVKTGGRK